MDSYGPVGDFPIRGKIALVTGGGSGISLAFAQQALAVGARGILIADLRLSDSGAAFCESNSDKVFFQKTDVTDWVALDRLFAASLEKWADVPDVYILGAGLFEPPGRNFWEDDKDVEMGRYLEIDVNVGHVVRLTRLAIKACLGRSKKGVVCSLSSGAGLAGMATAALYCATKHAVVGLTKSLAVVDKAQGVRICTICPGIVESPLWDEAKRAQYSFSESMDILSVSDVATAISALVEDGEKYPGGTVLEINKVEGEACTRIIPAWNVEPPKLTKFHKMIGEDRAAAEKMSGPLMTIMASERDNAWPSVL